MRSFAESLHVTRFSNAEFFASDLFYESFAIPFPIPRDNCGLSIPTPPEHWHQYVAFYKWPDASIEPVGFCNWIRYENVYLEGGLCVKRGFYRRLSREHWQACLAAGGLAQIMMESAARELNDCPAWFGYCGDRKSYIVTRRVGYEQTRHKYLIVKWFVPLAEADMRALEDKISAIGAF